MPVTQYDSTTAADIPVNAEAVAGYDPSGNTALDAGIAWSQADWDRFATPHKLHIARFAFMDGDCLDVETGDATPAQAGPWARKRIAAGLARPWVYVNFSNWTATMESCLGLPVRWWVANPTGIPHIVPGSDMTQYAFSDRSGGHYDLSLAADGALDGGSMPIEDHVVLSQPVAGKVMTGAHWFDWGQAVRGLLVPIAFEPDPTVGQNLQYTEAVKLGGQWLDRILKDTGPGDWGILDQFFNTLDVSGCIDPPACQAKQAPPAPQPPPPAPQPPPSTDPRVDDHEARLRVLEAWKSKVKEIS